MSRLSHQNVNNQRRANEDRYYARKAQQAEFQRAQMLQAQEAKERERQMIMQANLQAQARAGEMYAQQQYAKQAGRSKMADDTTLRQRNRQGDIKANNRLQYNAAQEAYRKQEAAEQAARMQAERDAALHGYGMEDASQLNQFNRGMANLTHGNTMVRDDALHWQGQGDAQQLQGYAQDNAHLQNKFNMGAAQQKHLYGQEDSRLEHSLNLERDKFGFGLDEQGADLRQRRGQQDATFANDLSRGNELDLYVREKLDEGWSYNPQQQQRLQNYEVQENSLRDALEDGSIGETDFTAKIQELRQKKRQVLPRVKPSIRNPNDVIKEQLGTYPGAPGLVFGVNPKGGPPTMYDIRERQSAQQKDPLMTARDEVISAANKVMYDNPGGEGQYGPMRKIEQDEAIWNEIRNRPELHAMFPGVVQKFMPKQPGPTNGSIDRIRNNREATAAEHQMMDQMGLPGGPPPYSQQQQMPPGSMPDDPMQAAANQQRMKSQTTAALVDSFSQEPEVVAAMQRNPQIAGRLIQQIQTKLQEYHAIRASGRDPKQRKPELLEEMNRLTQLLDNVPPANVDYGQGYSY